jgi:hypothetical protein
VELSDKPVLDLIIIQMPPSNLTDPSKELATCNQKSTKTDQLLVVLMLLKSLIIMVVFSTTHKLDLISITLSPLLDGEKMNHPENNIGLLETHGVNTGVN